MVVKKNTKKNTKNKTKKKVAAKKKTRAKKKIVKPEVSEKDETKSDPYAAWKFIGAFAIACVLILGGSLLFHNWQADRTQQQNSYHGFDFSQSAEGYWVTEVYVKGQPYLIPFYFHPTETEEVVFEEGLADAITDAAVKPAITYITFDPDAGSRPIIAGIEISRLMGSRYNLMNMEVRSALSRPAENAAETAVITCNNATDGVLVISFEETGANIVWHEGNCIHVEYKNPEESVRVADRFAYELLKIM